MQPSSQSSKASLTSQSPSLGSKTKVFVYYFIRLKHSPTYYSSRKKVFLYDENSPFHINLKKVDIEHVIVKLHFLSISTVPCKIRLNFTSLLISFTTITYQSTLYIKISLINFYFHIIYSILSPPITLHSNNHTQEKKMLKYSLNNFTPISTAILVITLSQ